MKENFEKIRNFVVDNKEEIRVFVYEGAMLIVGYSIGKATGGLSYNQINKLLSAGARLGYDYVKDFGLEAAEQAFKMIK